MNMFDVRGSEVYPTWDNDRYEYSSLPAFEIRGTDVYPTIYNDHYEYTSSAAFEIRDGYAYPTYMNDDDDGFDVPEAESSGTDMSFGEAMVMLGLFAGLQARANAKDRRRAAAERAAATSVPSAPPGWYPTDHGPRYWNGTTWTGQTPPVGFPNHQSTAHKKSRGPLVTAWVITFLTLGYILPWAVAVTRRTSNSTGVGWLCFFLGWTIVGWIVALVMACAGPAAALQR